MGSFCPVLLALAEETKGARPLGLAPVWICWQSPACKRNATTKLENLQEKIKSHRENRRSGVVVVVECPRQVTGEAPCQVIGKGKPNGLGPKLNTNEWAGPTWVQVYCCKEYGKFRVLASFLLFVTAGTATSSGHGLESP